MKIRALSLSTLLGLLGLLFFNLVMKAHASTIECITAFGEKKFLIEDSHISFNKEDEKGIYRSISSIKSESVRTHKKHLGFTKTLYVDGNRYKIHIQNIQNFSDLNDYLSITSPRGHEMTYPVNCHSV